MEHPLSTSCTVLQHDCKIPWVRHAVSSSAQLSWDWRHRQPRRPVVPCWTPPLSASWGQPQTVPRHRCIKRRTGALTPRANPIERKLGKIKFKWCVRFIPLLTYPGWVSSILKKNQQSLPKKIHSPPRGFEPWPKERYGQMTLNLIPLILLLPKF